LKKELKLPPESIAKLPAEQPTGTGTTANSSATTTAPADDGSEGSDNTTPAEPAPVVEEPTAALVMQYIQPLLARGVVVAELRRKLGHEKGRAWTVMFNEMLDFVVAQRNQPVPPNLIHSSARQRFSTPIGSLVAAVVKLPRSQDGSVHVSPETDILNSNPHMAAVRATKKAAKDTKNELPGGSATANKVVSQPLTEDDKFWAVDGPWTTEAAVRTMEPA